MMYMSYYRDPTYRAVAWFNAKRAGSHEFDCDADYYAALETEFNCTLRWHPSGIKIPIGIEFADDKCYTMFMLRWA
jgi:hypothetical protein